MSYLRMVALLGAVFGSGCSFDENEVNVDSNVVVREKETKANDNSEPATREDLELYLNEFKGGTSWSYGERKPGELAGTWVSNDGDGHKLIFESEGVFSETFNEGMTTGFFAISAEGKIVAYSKWNGIGVGSHFQFDGKSISGPKGPNPSVKWTRIE